MDPFEEFEFKPLTDGLGFHPKRDSLKESVEKSAVVESELNKVLPEPPPSGLVRDSISSGRTSYSDLMKALEKPDHKFADSSISGIEITQPLPRHGASTFNFSVEPEMERPQRSPSLPPQPGPIPQSIQPKLSDKTFIENSQIGTRRGAADNPSGGWVPVSTSISSALLDFVVILALSLIFLVSLLFVTQAQLMTVIGNISVDTTTQFSMLMLFVSVMQMYVVLSRSFFGKTLGDWTFECQLGLDKQVTSAYYPLQVVLRSLLVVATGIVTLPILSLLFRKDLAGKISGLQLYRPRQ